MISSTTNARSEGCFRLEWRLADQRTHLMGRSKAFIVPVCIDATGESGADLPTVASQVDARFSNAHGRTTEGVERARQGRGHGLA